MTLSHETQTAYETPQSIAEAFDTARKEVVAMTGDPLFHQACISSSPKIDPYEDMDKPAYWDTFANFAYTQTSAEIEQLGPNLLSDTKQLLAETPRYLFVEMQLEDRRSLSNQQREYARSIASYYNNVLRTFAYNHPKAHVSEVKQGLLAMTNISMEDEDVRQNASRAAYATLHGAQHEIAFGQVLNYTGYDFYAASTEQDLKGIDYVVNTAHGWLALDVKASSHALQAHKGKSQQYPYVVRDTSHIIVQSVARESEFHDTFFIPDALAAGRGGYIKNMLDDAAIKAA